MSSIVAALSALDRSQYIYAATALLIGVPVLATIINIISQLLPQDPHKPPLVWHWFPVIGSSVTYGLDPLKFFFDNREKYGDCFTFVLAGRKVTAALGPKGNDFVLGGKTSHVSAEDVYSSLTTPVFGAGVVYDCPNSMLMEQKRFVKFGLTTENFRRYTSLVVGEVDKFLATHVDFAAYRTATPGKLGEWSPVKIYNLMSELTIYTATRTLQGKEIRESVDGSFADLYHDLDGGFKPINLLLPGLPLPMNLRRDRAQKKMSNFYVDILKKRRETGLDGEPDMLAALMDQKYKDGRTLTDREIAHIMIALLMAGQHTSSATSAWTLLHLAHRPDIWQQLYDEQVKVFGKKDGSFRDIEYEDLRELPLIDSVIRETLRMHPPIHSILRQVKADLPVPATLATSKTSKRLEETTYIVPKGHLILASPFVGQMDPLIWKNADSWDPARWSDPSGVAARALDAYEDKNGEKVDYGFGIISKGTSSPYQPFGAGRHRCIGEQFAYLQLGTILSTLVRKLELQVDHIPKHNYRTMIIAPEAPDDIFYRRRA